MKQQIIPTIAILIVLYFLGRYIDSVAHSQIVWTIQAGLFIVVIALAFGLGGISILFVLRFYESFMRARAIRRQEEREADFYPIISPEHGIFVRELNPKAVIRPLHTNPAYYQNGKQAEVSAIELTTWQAWHMAHATAKQVAALPAIQEVPQLEAGLKPILPILLKAQRLIIGGGSDSGKSTIAKWLIAGRAEDSQIIVIDPHSPSRILGFDVIGAGRDYGAIGKSLESLELLMHERYSDVAKGLMGYFQHNRVSIFVDEWTGIIEEVPEAGKRLKTLLTESRKVNMFLTLLTHSTTLDGLGLPSAQLKKSALIVELVGGQDQPHRAFIHPQTSLGTDGKKSKAVEYALPGPFTGLLPAKENVLLELPSPEIIKIQKMADEGKSEYAMAQEFFGVEKPSKYHYTKIRELLERAQAAKKARLDNVEDTR